MGQLRTTRRNDGDEADDRYFVGCYSSILLLASQRDVLV